MATRLYTNFMMPNNDSIVDERVKYWIDVQDDYEKVFEQNYPLTPASSSLEARQSFWYTKLDDGKRFSCTPSMVAGFEEIADS